MSTMVTERLVSISAPLDGTAIEPCRTPTGILLARAYRREVRAIWRRYLYCNTNNHFWSEISSKQLLYVYLI